MPRGQTAHTSPISFWRIHGGFMSSEVPIGFLMSLSQDMEAMERFMRLSPAAPGCAGSKGAACTFARGNGFDHPGDLKGPNALRRGGNGYRPRAERRDDLFLCFDEPARDEGRVHAVRKLCDHARDHAGRILNIIRLPLRGLCLQTADGTGIQKEAALECGSPSWRARLTCAARWK